MSGRYHLYVSYACPWAHRTLITRALRGLEGTIPVTILSPRLGDDGWAFSEEDPDPVANVPFLRDVYLRAKPGMTGKVTVPVLYDRQTDTIVSNESREIMRMLDSEFDVFAEHGKSLAPPSLREHVDNVLTELYEPINNGVYRAGFASNQEAYDEAVTQLFAALDHWDAVLSTQRFLTGDDLTEADIALFTTLLRFDLVYYAHFKCNVRRIADYPHLQGFLRDLYQMKLIYGTCRLDHIKEHYCWSQNNVNPSRIVPQGPTLDLDVPHERGLVGVGP